MIKLSADKREQIEQITEYLENNTDYERVFQSREDAISMTLLAMTELDYINNELADFVALLVGVANKDENVQMPNETISVTPFLDIVRAVETTLEKV